LRHPGAKDGGLSSGTLNQITSNRIEIDSIAWERYVTGSPIEWLCGIGIFGSERVTQERTGEPFIVHSDMLATLIESGILGLAGYVFLFFTIGSILLRARSYVSRHHPASAVTTVALVLFVAFTLMGIAAALYLNVFVGWYYYGFIGLALAELSEYERDAMLVARWNYGHAHSQSAVFQGS
jgi:hypothetical protein